MEDQTHYVHTHDRWFEHQPEARNVSLTKLYSWYGTDFKQVAGTVLDFAARYDTTLRAAIDAGDEPQIVWLDYNWALNDVSNRD